MRCRTPQGVRGLKFHSDPLKPTRKESHPARGAWIEIIQYAYQGFAKQSHPARGAWIEIGTLTDEINSVSGRTPQGVRGLK